jgi:hypothetical protein
MEGLTKQPIECELYLKFWGVSRWDLLLSHVDDVSWMGGIILGIGFMIYKGLYDPDYFRHEMRADI